MVIQTMDAHWRQRLRHLLRRVHGWPAASPAKREDRPGTR
jgi:hypothetical protein